MSAQTPNSSSLVGVTLGNKYKLLQLLGSGGMADVYQAVQVGLKRSVAVKVMHPHLARLPGFQDRFQREARILASLRHPNIIQIYDFDEHQGWFYMVMEYISGGTLTNRLQQLHQQRQIMPLPDVYALFKALGDGLGYAHENGMVHRDIKPDNVLFTNKGEPILTDFGIARIVGATQFTQTGVSSGTPSYMSPEQARGERGDERSDIYSLGVMLYEIVTGRLPYTADTPFAVLVKHVQEPLPPPRQINPNLPPALVTVLEMALAKEPGQRYQTAGNMIAALHPAIREDDDTLPPTFQRTHSAPVPAATSTPPPAVYAAPQAAPPQKSNALLPIVVAGGTLIILALVAVIVGLLVFRTSQNGGQPASAVSSAENSSAGIVPPTDTPTPSATPAPPTDTPSPTVQPATVTPAPTEAGDQSGESSIPATATETPSREPTSTRIPATNTPPPTATATATPSAQPSPTPLQLSGRLLYVSDRDGDFEIYLKFLGSNRPDAKLTDNSANDWFPDWSPAGRIVFTSNRTGNYDLYTMTADGGGQQVLVDTPAWDEYGSWAPDSSQLVFSTTADTNGVSNSELHRRNPDGSLTRLTRNTGEDRNPDWAASGSIFYADNSSGNWDIFAIASSGGSPRNLTNHPAVDEDPSVSPDGRRLVFVRKERDTNGDGLVSDGDSGNIYVMNVDGSGATAVTAGSLDSSPAWSPDGAWVVFSRSATPNSTTTNLFATRLTDGTTVQLTDDSGVSNWGASWAP